MAPRTPNSASPAPGDRGPCFRYRFVKGSLEILMPAARWGAGTDLCTAFQHGSSPSCLLPIRHFPLSLLHTGHPVFQAIPSLALSQDPHLKSPHPKPQLTLPRHLYRLPSWEPPHLPLHSPVPGSGSSPWSSSRALRREHSWARGLGEGSVPSLRVLAVGLSQKKPCPEASWGRPRNTQPWYPGTNAGHSAAAPGATGWRVCHTTARWGC